MRAEMTALASTRLPPYPGPSPQASLGPQVPQGTVVQPLLSNNADIVHYVYK